MSVREGADSDAFVDRLIDEVEAAGLVLGGGGREQVFECFITRAEPSSTDEGDRQRIRDFLSLDPDVERYSVGGLVDGNDESQDQKLSVCV